MGNTILCGSNNMGYFDNENVRWWLWLTISVCVIISIAMFLEIVMTIRQKI